MRGWRSVGLVAAGALLTTSCGLAAAIHAADLPQGRLVGTWTSEGGTSLTYSTDHTFTGTGFDRVKAMADCAHPESLSSGRWAFYARPKGEDFAAPDEAATHGSALGLSFPGNPGCRVYVHLYGNFGDTDDPSMCPTDDADAGCPWDGYLKHDDPAPRS